MLRWMAAAIAGLAASACGTGMPTAVDAAPFEARMSEAPIRDGTYCGLTITPEKEVLVRGLSASGCATFSWIAAERTFQVNDNGSQISFAPVDLGGGLFMMQFTLSEEERAGKPYAFTLMAGMAEGDLLAVFPFPSDGKFSGEAISHRGITFARFAADAVTPAPVPAGAEDEMAARLAEIEAEYVYIAAGEPEVIRDLARSLVQRGVSYLKAETNRFDAPLWMGLPMLVRGEQQMMDHPPSADQMRSIEALGEKVGALVE